MPDISKIFNIDYSTLFRFLQSTDAALSTCCQGLLLMFGFCFFFFFPAVVKRILDFLGNVLCKYSVV